MKPTLLFYCQHSLGLGHLSRSFALCEALIDYFDVVLLCGGRLPEKKRPPDGVRVIELPPIGATVEGQLRSHEPGLSLDQARALRRRRILRTFRTIRPEVVLIEFFPFGKKRFADELMPLLRAARDLGSAAPVVACSVRDILVSRGESQLKFDDRASTLANDYFDVVLVHSDPAFVRFEESFRPSVRLRTPIQYTGFVVPTGSGSPVGNSTREPAGEIVVSAGGGVVGGALLRAAAEAHRLLTDVPMTIVAGPFLPEPDWAALCDLATPRPDLTVRRCVPDLGVQLRTARASISQCGYNTAMDILRTRVPALVVPFAERGEDEQIRRARRMEELGALRVLDPAALRTERLADEIACLLQFRPHDLDLDMQGGPNAARILADLHTDRFGAKAS